MAENEELQEMGEGETRQKILVADDEASIRRILETRLKMVGYDVVVANKKNFRCPDYYINSSGRCFRKNYRIGVRC